MATLHQRAYGLEHVVSRVQHGRTCLVCRNVRRRLRRCPLASAPRYPQRDRLRLTEGTRMATLAYNAQEIGARELKPGARAGRDLPADDRGPLQALPGVRGEAKRDPRQARRDRRVGRNQVYSDIRALKVDLSFAIGGVKNHEIYFEHLGGDGGDPDGPIGTLVRRDFGSIDAWRDDLKATGMAGRGGPGLRTTGTRGVSSTTSATLRTRSPSGTRHRSSPSTSTSTRTSSTTRPIAARTSKRSSTTSTGRLSTTGSTRTASGRRRLRR